MVQPLPGSLPEGAAERSEAEGVYYDERKSSKISEPIKTVSKPPAQINHRTALPQSRPLGVPAPSEREPGMGVRTIQPGACETMGLAGDFHRPYETQKPFPFTIHRTTLPQSRPLDVTAPSEREPGMGAHHSSGCSLKSQVGGRFSSPLRDSEVGSFYHSVRCGRLSSP